MPLCQFATLHLAVREQGAWGGGVDFRGPQQEGTEALSHLGQVSPRSPGLDSWLGRFTGLSMCPACGCDLSQGKPIEAGTVPKRKRVMGVKSPGCPVQETSPGESRRMRSVAPAAHCDGLCSVQSSGWLQTQRPWCPLGAAHVDVLCRVPKSPTPEGEQVLGTNHKAQ